MWLASRVTHGLIYTALVAMPLIGWAQSCAAARHLKLFGSPFPALVGHDRDLADTLAAWHENVGWAFLALIGLHALAAIYHHYVRRDDLLRAMLPGYKPPVVATAWSNPSPPEVATLAPTEDEFPARRRAEG
jgi:cytochrome b561